METCNTRAFKTLGLAGALFISIAQYSSAQNISKLEFSPCSQSDPELASTVLVLDLREGAINHSAMMLVERGEKYQALAAALRSCPQVESSLVDEFVSDADKYPTVQRLLLTTDSKLTIIVFRTAIKVDVRVSEKIRKTKLFEDFGNLLDVARAAFAGATVDVLRADYVLRERRATVTFDVIPYSDAGEPEPDNAITVATLTTGPVEHFSLSANIPVNSVNQLTLTEDNQIATRETPREFLAGLDWYYGDVMTDSFPRFSPERLGVKLLLAFDKEPLNTVGLVAAYRHAGFSLIAGPIWVRQPASNEAIDPNSQVPMEYVLDWRVGIGFDVLHALKWITERPEESPEE